MIREVHLNDYNSLMQLYSQLHGCSIQEKTSAVMTLWSKMIQDKNYHIIVIEENGKIVSSCTCVIIPNLTHNHRPYALIENIITDEKYRRKGLATQCLNYARELAIKENCYKLMLLTGSKKESTLNFYRKAGYNSEDKTGFIQWI